MWKCGRYYTLLAEASASDDNDHPDHHDDTANNPTTRTRHNSDLNDNKSNKKANNSNKPKIKSKSTGSSGSSRAITSPSQAAEALQAAAVDVAVRRVEDSKQGLDVLVLSALESEAALAHGRVYHPHLNPAGGLPGFLNDGVGVEQEAYHWSNLNSWLKSVYYFQNTLGRYIHIYIYIYVSVKLHSIYPCTNVANRVY